MSCRSTRRTSSPLSIDGGRFAMVPVQTVDRNPEPRVLVALPLDHVVLRLAEEAVLRSEERRQMQEGPVVTLQNARAMHERRGDRCGVEQCTHSCAAQADGPELVQMINRQPHAHLETPSAALGTPASRGLSVRREVAHQNAAMPNKAPQVSMATSRGEPVREDTND